MGEINQGTSTEKNLLNLPEIAGETVYQRRKGKGMNWSPFSLKLR